MQVVYIKEFVYFFLFFIFFRYNQRVLIQPLCICINFCVCTWVHMCEYSCYYVLLFLLFFFLFFIFNNLSICLVRDGIRRMGKKIERENEFVCCLVWRERMKVFWWSPGIFSPSPPKIHLSKLERKQERKLLL